METIETLIHELEDQRRRPLHVRIDSIAERLGVPIEEIKPTLRSLYKKKLIRVVQGINNLFIALTTQ